MASNMCILLPVSVDVIVEREAQMTEDRCHCNNLIPECRYVETWKQTVDLQCNAESVLRIKYQL